MIRISGTPGLDGKACFQLSVGDLSTEQLQALLDQEGDSGDIDPCVFDELGEERDRRRMEREMPVMIKIPDSFDELARLLRTVEYVIHNRGGPLMATFVKQAIMEFAREVSNADPAKITEATNGFVTGEAWRRCAREALDYLNDRDDIPF